MPPSLIGSNADSLGEQSQRAFPDTPVVKTLNMANHEVMVEPSGVPGEHDMFVCGNDDAAKRETGGLLESFGWPATSIHDLGDIPAARGMGAYLLLWLRLWGTSGSGHFDIEVVR